LTAHAGEGCGVESILAAIESLHVERIGHGVRCVEDENCVLQLKNLQIPLELCPTSNVCTGVIKNISLHPIRQLFDKGLKVTVNSDDPTFFNCNLNSEFEVLHKQLGFTLNELKQLSLNAVDASFLPKEEKLQLLATVVQEMNAM